jgi:carbon storage regulator CsrA
MLVLTRRIGEVLQIGESVIVKVVAIDGRRVRLAIDAPPSVPIRRGELSCRTADELPRPASGQPDAPSVEPAPATVLFVDDEPSIRQCCKDEFERDGFRVLLAVDGQQALALLKTTPADVVVLDEHMPGWSGRETARRIRQLDPSTRIILFTGDPAFRTLQDAAIDTTVLKAADPEELKSAVSRAVARKSTGLASDAPSLALGQ